MFNFITQSSALSLVMKSDFFTWLILLSLFFTSVICIAVIGLKFVYFRKELKSIEKMLERSRRLDIQGFTVLQNDFKDNLGGAFLSDGLKELQSFLESSSGNITEQEINRYDIALGQYSDNLLLDAERYLPILGVSAAVSPLVGLFGTIWGLIHSFASIGAEKTADLAVVAPGMAMALTTTLAGLIVAIPAMIFFHYYSNQLRKLEQSLGHLSDKFFAVSLHTFTNSIDPMTIQSKTTESGL